MHIFLICILLQKAITLVMVEQIQMNHYGLNTSLKDFSFEHQMTSHYGLLIYSNYFYIFP